MNFGKEGGIQIKKDQQYLFIGAVALIIALALIFVQGDVPASSTSQVSDESIFRSSEELVSQGSDELVVNVYGHTGEPETGFDPLLGWGCGHVNFEPLIQSTLFKSADDGSMINDLATNYSISSMENLDCKYRDDVRFTDGEKLTAEDVAFIHLIQQSEVTPSWIL